MSATGVKTFNSGGTKVERFESTPIPPGEYEACIKAMKWSEQKADGAGKIPYLSGPLEILGTASTEGGKNRQMYVRLWLAAVAKPGKGRSAIAGQDQVIALARAFGEELEGIPLVTVTQALEDGGERKTDILNPKALLQWVKNHDGQVFKLRIKTERGTKEYPNDKSVVDYYIEAEAPAGEEAEEYEMDASGDEQPAEEYTDTEALVNDDLPADEPGEAQEDEFEPLPPPRQAKVAAKTVSNGHNKVVAKPAAKVVSAPAKKAHPIQRRR